MQVMLGRDIYIPGVGLFGVKQKEFSKYSFKKDYTNLPFSKRRSKSSVWLKFITEDGKLSYDKYETYIMNIVHEGKFKIIRSVQTKNSIIKTIIENHLGVENLEVVLKEPYQAPDFSSIKEKNEREEKEFQAIIQDMEQHSDTWEKFINDLDLSTLVCHPQILKDIIVFC